MRRPPGVHISLDGTKSCNLGARAQAGLQRLLTICYNTGHQVTPGGDCLEYRTLVEVADTLIGERVLVRAYRADDAEALFAALNESREHLYPWFPFFHQSHYELAETRDMLVRWQASWLLRENFFLGIFLCASGELLGNVGFEAHDWEGRFFEIGYWIRQQVQGNGYVTEAVRLVTDYLFTHLDAQRVEIRCDARNQRSAAVARRLGFQQEGCLRRSALAADSVLADTLVFSLIPSDSRWP